MEPHQKECPYCKSLVRDDVIKCPVCREWINRWAKGGPYRHTVLTVLVVLLFFGGLEYFHQHLASQILDSSRSITAHAVAKVVSSHKVVGKFGVEVVGEVKNDGPTSNNAGLVEVSFFDKSNRLVDVGRDYLVGKFQSGEVRPFKVKFGCSKHPVHGDYDHYSTAVR